MGKKLLAALAAFMLLFGLVACGGDDDDDDDAAASDDTSEEMTDEGGDEGGSELDPALATVCSDTGQADDGTISPDEAAELAEQSAAAAEVAPEEIAASMTGAADYFQQLADAGEDVAAEDIQFSEHIMAVNEWCEANAGEAMPSRREYSGSLDG